MRRLALVLISALSLIVAGCGGEAVRDQGDGKLQVIASFYPVAEAAGRVAGARAEITNLTPAGTEPHDIELTPDQVDQLQDADLVLYLGGGFQPAIEKVVARRDRASVDLLEALPLEKGAAEEGETSDPHFWLDPALMERAVERIQRALGDARPGDRAEIERNAAAYRGELRELDARYKTTLSTCRRRDLVTSHAAFHYLATRYGLSQEPIAGLSPETEPDPKRLAELTDLVRRRNATTVFYETLVSREVAETLARETGTRTAVLNPLEGLTSEQEGKGASYVSVMDGNLAALKDALGCG
ncbi:MAG: zinc ABC transporter substrate-binding protein [Actinobacteria bacterium]|nr:zinc ABC transporter substrate-binding protein [Actinomycetota bacterium]